MLRYPVGAQYAPLAGSIGLKGVAEQLLAFGSGRVHVTVAPIRSGEAPKCPKPFCTNKRKEAPAGGFYAYCTQCLNEASRQSYLRRSGKAL